VYAFYKSHDSFKLLIQLIKKARNNKLSVSLVLENDVQIQEFSTKFWNMGDTIIHGLISDGFIEKQPVMLDVNLHKKDVAIIYENANCDYDKLKQYQRVFFIGSQIHPIDAEHSGENAKFEAIESKYWMIKNGIWSEVSKAEFVVK
jgi:DNA polymerase IIIc chi subunit